MRLTRWPRSTKRGVAPLRRKRGDLTDQLVGHGVGEGMEIVDDSEKGAGAADHILPIPLGQAARRLCMKGGNLGSAYR